MYFHNFLGPDDHPFLRMHKGFQNLSVEAGSGAAGPLVRKQTTEEEDMEFFEKRYQERVSTDDAITAINQMVKNNLTKL